MSFWSKTNLNLLNLSINFLVKSKAIPVDPIKELHLNTACHFLYILPYHSKIDLLTLRQQCFSIGLPDPLNLIKIDEIKLPAYIFVDDPHSIFHSYSPNICKDSIKIFMTYLDLHCNNPEFNIQVLPVLVMFGRAPGRDSNSHGLALRRLFNGIQKLFTLIWLGRDSFVSFLPTISLRQMADKYGTNKIIANKLARVARIYFLKQKLAAIGPKLPVRLDLFNKLLASKTIEKAIEDEAKVKKISIEKVRHNAITIMEEIAANFSYEIIRITDRVLSWAWNRLYQGIDVQHVERVRQLAQDGHEIVYIPSHRSHMDYLLLSYVIYHQGLAPPHIAAGINLNFWPAGPVFRYLGAFFIRRSFKGNKLYCTVFREYFSELLVRGYAVEYFIEGSRSRTGRLLEPKTGILSMTLQAMLRSDSRSIVIIPIYIGYEQVLEITTYAKELKGATKKREGFFLMLNGLRKLRKLGHGYVNFGQPIALINYLNKYVPEWRRSINNATEYQRPMWLNSIVIQLANKIMIRINDAAAVNAINLCSTALLASSKYSLTREQLIEQIDCYIQILRNVPYSNNSTTPNKTAEQLLENALSLNVFKIKDDNNISNTIALPHKNAILMTYYRNNIIHLLVLPSLIANIILHNKNIQRRKISYQIELIYPFLKAELFIRYNIEELPKSIDSLLNELARQQLILLTTENFVTINPTRINSLQLLANSVEEILQRYVITLALLSTISEVSLEILEKESRNISQDLSVLRGISVYESFDKDVFFTLVNTLKQEGYISRNSNIITNINVKQLYQVITKVVSPKVFLTIKEFTRINNHKLLLAK